MKNFSKEELAKNDGKNGAPAFVAYRGKVYDFTKSSRWEDGEHENMHIAGKDLTDDLETMSPHGANILERFTVIGTLSED
jgi:predicted heme/steroid binding protein